MPERRLVVPDLSLVLLVGPSGSGKSTFAARHFRRTEIVSSDECRALVSDDPNDQAATKDAFDLVRVIAGKRLARGRLAVIDATNVQPEARKPFLDLAREHDVLPVAIVFQLPAEVCEARNGSRPDRAGSGHFVRRQVADLRKSVRGLSREGFRQIHLLASEPEVAEATIERQRLYNDRRDDSGPFDIVGDVHGCAAELSRLLEELGWREEGDGSRSHPEGRKLVFLGDLVDRGPDVAGVLRVAMATAAAGRALVVAGNHEKKLQRALEGRDVRVTHGLAESLEQVGRLDADARGGIVRFLDSLISHYVLDGGRLVVAHAGLKESYQGRASGRVREFALYGETTGETDEYGLPVRHPWAADYRGAATVVYGHTPVPEPEWVNRTICIDTGCVFGGRLTALRWPEKELVSIPAERVWFAPAKPFPGQAPDAAESGQQRADELLSIEDVLGRRHVGTRFAGSVAVPEANAAAALEAMSRFAADPRWLVHLPPTMSPVETSDRENRLEHPAEAFRYFRSRGVPSVVCEEKHMGSRAIVVVSRDGEASQRRFGIGRDTAGIVLSRTGRRFFPHPATEAVILDSVRRGLEGSGAFDRHGSDWFVLDAELMPWSAKAEELVTGQYAPVGAAGELALEALGRELSSAGEGAGELRRSAEARLRSIRLYRESYRRYAPPVTSPADLRLAPFHLLAAEGKVFSDRSHAWHLEELAQIVAAAPAHLVDTPHRVVDLSDPAAEESATAWWEEITAAGAEGMVVKPSIFVTKGAKGFVQPALKVRGAEYLRIIYGPEYDLPGNLERLRARSVGTKRGLAHKELALGLEALERFVRREPLRRIHECVFAILALESEPVDPRL